MEKRNAPPLREPTINHDAAEPFVAIYTLHHLVTATYAMAHCQWGLIVTTTTSHSCCGISWHSVLDFRSLFHLLNCIIVDRSKSA